MKKVFVALIAVILVISSITTVFAAGTPTFVLGRAAFKNTDEIVTMTIKAENFSSVSAIQFTVLYDSTKIELQNVSDGSGDILENIVAGAAVNGFADATVSCVEPGKVNVVWDSESAYSISLNEVILELEFKSIAEGQFVEKLEIVTEGEDAPLVRKDTNEGKELEEFDFNVEEEVIGFNVSGNVTSYLDSSETVTVELYEEGNAEPSYATTFTGNNGAYAFEEIPSGTYTMKVSKKNHVAREYEITVGTEDLVQDVKICPIGDANCNGSINLMDYRKVLQHIRGSKITDEYELICADANQNGSINLMDYRRILQHIRGNSMWT